MTYSCEDEQQILRGSNFDSFLSEKKKVCCSLPVLNQQFLLTHNIGYVRVIMALGSIQPLNIHE